MGWTKRSEARDYLTRRLFYERSSAWSSYNRGEQAQFLEHAERYFECCVLLGRRVDDGILFLYEDLINHA